METTEVTARFLNDFPYPIAFHLGLAAAATQTGLRLLKLLDAFAVAMKYCALICISEYLRDSETVNPIADTNILRLIGTGSLKDSVAVVDELIRTYSSRSRDLFMKELTPFYLRDNGELTVNGFAIRHLINLYHETKRGEWTNLGLDLRASEKIPELLVLLGELRFLRRYELVQVMDRMRDPNAPDDSVLRVRKWLGTHPVDELTIEGNHANGRRDVGNGSEMCLWDGAAHKLLSLYPFVVADLHPHSLPGLPFCEDVFLLIGKQLEAASFASVSKGLDGARVSSRYQNELEELLQKCANDRTGSEVSWESIAQQVFRDHTAKTLLEISQTKYERAFYTTRAVLEGSVREFFRGENERAILVVGDSGTGKTSFLCHFVEERVRQGDIVLLYKAGDLGAAGERPIDRITNDLSARRAHAHNFDAIMSHLRRLSGGRNLVVIFDAINEHRNPELFLQGLDLLLEEFSPFRFVKVLLSCRSSSWEILSKKQILDTKLFYKVRGNPEIRVGGFEENELKDAVRLYAQEYELRTGFTELRRNSMVRVLALMRDPLMLRLISEAYRGMPIPPDITSIQVFDAYCTEKIKSPADRHFIKEILTAMARVGSGSVPLGTVARTNAPGEVDKGDEIHSPYSRLVDAGVLQEEGQPGDDRVQVKTLRFTYDRVHEYLTAREEILPTLPDNVEQMANMLVDLLGHSMRYSTLWGAVKSTLMMLMERGLLEALLSKLAPLDDFQVRAVIIETMVAIGRERREFVNQLLRSSIFLSSESEVAKRAGLQIACDLDMHDVVADAATDSDPKTRQITALYVYWYWRKRSSATDELVDAIFERAKREINLRGWLERARRHHRIAWGDMFCLQSFVSITVMMSQSLLLDPASLAPIASKWNGLFQSYGMMLPVAQRLISRIGVKIIDSALASNSVALTYETLDHFFAHPRNSSYRKAFASLVRFVDPDSGPIDEIGDQLLSESRSPDIMYCLGVIAVVISQGIENPNASFELVKRMFELDSNISKYNAMTSLLFLCLLNMDALPTDWTDFFQVALLRLWTNKTTQVNFKGRTGEIGLIEYPMILECRQGQHGEIPFVSRLLALPWEGNPINRLVNVIHALDVVGQYGYPLQALATMRPWFGSTDDAVHRALIQAIAKVRVTFPDEVDLFLSDYPGLSREAKEMVRLDWRGSGPGPAFAQSGMLALVGLFRYPELRKRLAHVLQATFLQSANSRSAVRRLAGWCFEETLPWCMKTLT